MFEEETVLMILALALDTSTLDHRLRYLLKKLYGKDGLVLDREKTIFFTEIEGIAEELRE